MRQRWRPLSNLDLSVWNELSRDMERTESMLPLAFPELRAEPRVLVYSDYSGKSSLKDFQTLSYLLVSDRAVASWNVERQQIRDQYLQGRGEMSFKDLHDGPRARALMPLLTAANAVTGLSVTVAIEGTIGRLFGDGPANDREAQTFAWKPAVQERALRVIQFGGFFVAGLIREGQSVGWITDQDEIVANPRMLTDARAMWRAWLAMLLGGASPSMDVATTANDDGTFLAKDTTAIPDFVAGALAEVLREIRAHTTFLDESVAPGTPLAWSELQRMAPLSDKTRQVLAWLSDETHPLKRLAVVFTKAQEANELRRTWVRFGAFPAAPKAS